MGKIRVFLKKIAISNERLTPAGRCSSIEGGFGLFGVFGLFGGFWFIRGGFWFISKEGENGLFGGGFWFIWRGEMVYSGILVNSAD